MEDKELFDQSLSLLRQLASAAPTECPQYDHPDAFILPKPLAREWKAAHKALAEYSSGRHKSLGPFAEALLPRDPAVEPLTERLLKIVRIPYVAHEGLFSDLLNTAKELLCIASNSFAPRSVPFLSRRVFEAMARLSFLLSSGEEMWMVARILYFRGLSQYNKQLRCLTENPRFVLARNAAIGLHQTAVTGPDDHRRRIWNQHVASNAALFRGWGLEAVKLEGRYDSFRYRNRYGFEKQESSLREQLEKVQAMCKALDDRGESIRTTDWKFGEAYSFLYRGLSEFVHSGALPHEKDYDFGKPRLLPEDDPEKVPIGMALFAGTVFVAESLNRLLRFERRAGNPVVTKSQSRLKQISDELARNIP